MIDACALFYFFFLIFILDFPVQVMQMQACFNKLSPLVEVLLIFQLWLFFSYLIARSLTSHFIKKTVKKREKSFKQPY